MSHNWYVIIGYEHLLFKCFIKDRIEKMQIPQKNSQQNIKILQQNWSKIEAKSKQNQSKIKIK